MNTSRHAFLLHCPNPLNLEHLKREMLFAPDEGHLTAPPPSGVHPKAEIRKQRYANKKANLKRFAFLFANVSSTSASGFCDAAKIREYLVLASPWVARWGRR
jgi:hypothetical protein